MRELIRKIKQLIPLNKEKKEKINSLKEYLGEQDIKKIITEIKKENIGIHYEDLKIPSEWVKEQTHPQISLGTTNPGLRNKANKINETIKKQAKEKAFKEFSKKAEEIIKEHIGPTIIGFEEIKKATTWQLLATEPTHLLLLGDPGTGKTEILISASQLAPISSYGLGSGTSAAGLSATKKGGKIIKGLLPMADKGLCCIDELNLLKQKDRGALLNAMEKGFISYDKGTEHAKLDARVKVLATANPKGDRFIGKDVKFLKEQVPFDPALLSRFHIVFLVRKPNTKEFLRITKNLVEEKTEKKTRIEEIEFIKEYIKYAQKTEVEFDKNLEPIITDFFEDLKNKEEEYLIEITPRTVLGVVRLTKAKARIELRKKVKQEDLVTVLKTVKKSLNIPPDPKSKRQ